jgi:hypothetical protein
VRRLFSFVGTWLPRLAAGRTFFVTPRAAAPLSFAFSRSRTRRRITLVVAAAPWPLPTAAGTLPCFALGTNFDVCFRLFLALKIKIDIFAGRLDVFFVTRRSLGLWCFATAPAPATAPAAPAATSSGLLSFFISSHRRSWLLAES